MQEPKHTEDDTGAQARARDAHATQPCESESVGTVGERASSYQKNKKRQPPGLSCCPGMRTTHTEAARLGIGIAGQSARRHGAIAKGHGASERANPGSAQCVSTAPAVRCLRQQRAARALSRL